MATTRKTRPETVEARTRRLLLAAVGGSGLSLNDWMRKHDISNGTFHSIRRTGRIGSTATYNKLVAAGVPLTPEALRLAAA